MHTALFFLELFLLFHNDTAEFIGFFLEKKLRVNLFTDIEVRLQKKKVKCKMTAIECLKILRKGFCILLVWNLILTCTLLVQCNSKKEEQLNQQICNLETIPQYELVEVE